MAGTKIRNMEEFAKLSGISRPTVSKYFNDPDSVRASNRIRIEAALERYEYRPNIYAMNQNRKLTKNIGIVVPLLVRPLLCRDRAQPRAALYRGRATGPRLFSVRTGIRSWRWRCSKPCGRMKASGRPAGAIGPGVETGRRLKKFCNDDVPTLIFDSSVEELGLAFVGSDNFQFTVAYHRLPLSDGRATLLFRDENAR